MLPLSSVLCFAQFQVRSHHYHTKPVRIIPNFVDLQTNLGILAHPLNLFAESREDVDAVIRLIRKGHPARYTVDRSTNMPVFRLIRVSAAHCILVGISE